MIKRVVDNTASTVALSEIKHGADKMYLMKDDDGVWYKAISDSGTYTWNKLNFMEIYTHAHYKHKTLRDLLSSTINQGIEVYECETYDDLAYILINKK